MLARAPIHEPRIFYLRFENPLPSSPRFRSVTRRIFKKNPRARSGAHEAPSARPLQPVRPHFMAAPHTRARQRTQACRVRTHTFDLVCKTHGRVDLRLETELFFDEISSRSMDVIVSPSLLLVVHLCFLFLKKRGCRLKLLREIFREN